MSFYEQIMEALFGPIHFTVTAEEHMKQGIAKLAIDDFQGALHDFDAVVEMEPENPMGYYNRGLLYEYLDKRELAVEDILIACKLFNERGDTEHHCTCANKLKEFGTTP